MPAARSKVELQGQKKAKVRKRLVAFNWERAHSTRARASWPSPLDCWLPLHIHWLTGVHQLASSYHELLEYVRLSASIVAIADRRMCREFSSKELRTVGNYALGRLIGKGSFGKVYLATHKLTNGSKVRLAQPTPRLSREAMD